MLPLAFVMAITGHGIYTRTGTAKWSGALSETLAFDTPLKNIPTFYEDHMFITAFTRAHRWSLS
jgi:hypothetical protein